jgi:hypothetical protein
MIAPRQTSCSQWRFVDHSFYKIAISAFYSRAKSDRACIDGDDRTGLGNLTGRLTRRRRLPDRLGAGRRPRTAVGVLLEFKQLRHARLKFTNRRLAVVTADDRPRFEPVPGHARNPRLQRDGAAVVSSRRTRRSCRQQGDNEKNGPTKVWFEQGNHFITFKGQAAGRSVNGVPAGQHLPLVVLVSRITR